MEEMPIVGRDDEQRMFQQLTRMHGGPAYIRRGRLVEETLERLLSRCRQQRDEWLRLVRIELGSLHGLSGAWVSLRPMLADDSQIRVLAELLAELRPDVREPVAPTTSDRLLRRSLHELVEGITFFNQRWDRFLSEADLTPVNQARDGYNRYYVLEKECAVRSARVARQGFAPLPPLTRGDLAAMLPLLRVPKLA